MTAADLVSLFPLGSALAADGVLTVGGGRADDLAAEFGTPDLGVSEQATRSTLTRRGVLWQQVTKRSRDEQLRLPALLPARHLDNPSPATTTSGSKGS